MDISNRPWEHLVQRRRKLANTHVGRIVDTVDDRGGSAADAEFTYPLGLQRIRQGSRSSSRMTVLRDVGIDRDVVFRVVANDDVAVAP